ncbi:unnamed protein product [Arctia plantaginis]|uniref:Uncharacterized protein n=1 Tax=Arctia plantaginis TaxID=874455 RepID=A0A8S1BMY0_ARCPL|nr:unnamed protein product [Arctia plantaginis]
MEEGNSVQVLEKISSEVDESQIKVILSSQCIKAQAFLLEKLKKQSERHKETCSFISSANLKVETEIKQAEQEIRSMLIAQETLKSANVEIKKEWLLAKNRKADIIEHVNEGIKKYGAKWSECKTRYESIPFVQNLLQSLEKQKTTDQTINDMDKEITKLYDEMEIRRKKCNELNIIRAVELANFMIHERPKTIKTLKEKAEMINSLTQDIELLLKDRAENMIAVAVTEPMKLNEFKGEEALNKHADNNLSQWEDDPLIPKLDLANFDLDISDVNLDQVKMKKDEILNTLPSRTNSILQIVEKNVEHEKAYEYMISPYFTPYKEDRSRNFSERKLINILEDININSGDVYNIVKKVNPEKLKPVGEISVDAAKHYKGSVDCQKDKDDRKNEPIVSEKIEEIDLTSSTVENIIIPPTQFLDITLSDDTPRKRVCFDLSCSMQINEIDESKEDMEEVNEPINQSLCTQLDVSTASDESLMRMKEILLKKHNLDLSPQFVYAKNNVLQKKDDDKIITSKFFENHTETIIVNDHDDIAMEVDEQPEPAETEETLKPQEDVQAIQSPKDGIVMPMDEDKMIISTSQTNKVNLKPFEEQNSEKTVAGLLFTHGRQEIPDSLNVSLSTNGYEDSDFPHCFDSSLLLSPKANVLAEGDNNEALSQEVPNFLSGFRKAGLSFFGGPSTSSEPKPELNATNEPTNFSFNFGGDNKNRGGLFSLFR